MKSAVPFPSWRAKFASANFEPSQARAIAWGPFGGPFFFGSLSPRNERAVDPDQKRYTQHHGPPCPAALRTQNHAPIDSGLSSKGCRGRRGARPHSVLEAVGGHPRRLAPPLRCGASSVCARVAAGRSAAARPPPSAASVAAAPFSATAPRRPGLAAVSKGPGRRGLGGRAPVALRRGPPSGCGPAVSGGAGLALSPAAKVSAAEWRGLSRPPGCPARGLEPLAPLAVGVARAGVRPPPASRGAVGAAGRPGLLEPVCALQPGHSRGWAAGAAPPPRGSGGGPRAALLRVPRPGDFFA